MTSKGTTFEQACAASKGTLTRANGDEVCSAMDAAALCSLNTPPQKYDYKTDRCVDAPAPPATRYALDAAKGQCAQSASGPYASAVACVAAQQQWDAKAEICRPATSNAGLYGSKALCKAQHKFGLDAAQRRCVDQGAKGAFPDRAACNAASVRYDEKAKKCVPWAAATDKTSKLYPDAGACQQDNKLGPVVPPEPPKKRFALDRAKGQCAAAAGGPFGDLKTCVQAQQQWDPQAERCVGATSNAGLYPDSATCKSQHKFGLDAGARACVDQGAKGAFADRAACNTASVRYDPKTKTCVPWAAATDKTSKLYPDAGACQQDNQLGPIVPPEPPKKRFALDAARGQCVETSASGAATFTDLGACVRAQTQWDPKTESCGAAAGTTNGGLFASADACRAQHRFIVDASRNACVDVGPTGRFGDRAACQAAAFRYDPVAKACVQGGGDSKSTLYADLAACQSAHPPPAPAPAPGKQRCDDSAVACPSDFPIKARYEGPRDNVKTQPLMLCSADYAARFPQFPDLKTEAGCKDTASFQKDAANRWWSSDLNKCLVAPITPNVCKAPITSWYYNERSGGYGCGQPGKVPVC